MVRNYGIEAAQGAVRRVRRALAAFALVIVVAATAFAAGLDTAVGTLRSACDARVVSIGAPGSSAVLRKEQTKLQAAADALARFTGADIANDGSALRDAAKALARSKTTDGAVISAVGGVVSTLTGTFEQEFDDAEAAASGLFHPTVIAKVKQLLKAARAAADTATGLAATDPVGALTLLADARGKVIAAGTATIEGANVGAPPAGIAVFRHSSGLVFVENSGTEEEILMEAVFDLRVTYSDGTTKRVKISHRSVNPAAYASGGGYMRVIAPNSSSDLDSYAMRSKLQDAALAKGKYVLTYTGTVAIRLRGRALFFAPIVKG